MSWTRRRFIASGLAGGAALLAGCSRGERESGREAGAEATRGARRGPNILLVFTDQERFFHSLPSGLALPGHEWLEARGVRFVQHMGAATMCGPSRSVMMTGLQTARTGMFDNTDNPMQGDLDPRIPTLGHRLRRHGYYTAYQGKWHLSAAFHPDEETRPGQFEGEMDAYGFSDFASRGDVIGQQLGGHENDGLVAAAALHWLRTAGRQLADEGRPWLLAVSFVNPHDVMYFNTDLPDEAVQDTGTLLMTPARAPDHALYRATWDVALPRSLHQPLGEPGRPAAHAEYDRAWSHFLGRVPPEARRWRSLQDFYLNSLRAVDAHLERLLHELDQLGLAGDTIVVFTSDHGEMAGAHGLRGKGPFAYREALHVPLYIVHPDVAGGQECRALTSHIDLVPTLLSMAGATEQAAELPGRDVSPVVSRAHSADVHAVRQAALFTYSGLVINDAGLFEVISEARRTGRPVRAVLDRWRPEPGKRGNLRCIFDGRYKLARYFAPTRRNRPETLESLYAANDVELYDLYDDPDELHNLAAARGEADELVARLNGRLNALMDAEFGPDDGHELPRKVRLGGRILGRLNL